MTNAELVALLREARDFMRQAAIDRGPCPDCTECDHRDTLIAKADAALAAHEAEERVEWRRQIQYAEYHDKNLTVWAFRDGTWGWELTYPPMNLLEGRCATEDEAKSAAIAAAGRMK